MNIFLNASSGIPLYEQIKAQIKFQIIGGLLTENEPMPSMRVLANDLGISLITTKRAYDDLIQEGVLYTVSTKGCFVAKPDLKKIRTTALKSITEKLEDIVCEAKKYGVEVAQMREIFDGILNKI